MAETGFEPESPCSWSSMLANTPSWLSTTTVFPWCFINGGRSNTYINAPDAFSPLGCCHVAKFNGDTHKLCQTAGICLHQSRGDSFCAASFFAPTFGVVPFLVQGNITALYGAGSALAIWISGCFSKYWLQFYKYAYHLEDNEREPSPSCLDSRLWQAALIQRIRSPKRSWEQPLNWCPLKGLEIDNALLTSASVVTWKRILSQPNPSILFSVRMKGRIFGDACRNGITNK